MISKTGRISWSDLFQKNIEEEFADRQFRTFEPLLFFLLMLLFFFFDLNVEIKRTEKKLCFILELLADYQTDFRVERLLL